MSNEEQYPFMYADDGLAEAEEALLKVERVFVHTFALDGNVAPPDIDAAWTMTNQVQGVIRSVREKISSLARSDRERYEHDDEFFSRDK